MLTDVIYFILLTASVSKPISRIVFARSLVLVTFVLPLIFLLLAEPWQWQHVLIPVFSLSAEMTVACEILTLNHFWDRGQLCLLSIDPRIELSLLGWISRVGGHNKDLVELLHTQKREDTLQ